MARIGIFIDALQGSIPVSFRERLAAYVQGLPSVAFCSVQEDLTCPEGLKGMAERLAEEKVDRAVVVGGSPRLYETSFHKWGRRLPLNPYLIAVANVREQGLYLMKDEGTAFEKARATIEKIVRMASASKPIEAESLSLKPEVLVLGGGIVGISVALSLARSGIHVSLLEKGRRLGGRVSELRRFYSRPDDVQKWLEEKVSQVSRAPDITLYTRAELKELNGHLGRFKARIRNRDGREDILSPSAIVMATGYAVARETGGIYGHKRVIPLREMERLLSEARGPSLLWQEKKVDMVSFLLDEVNEDIKVDSINAVKQGLLLREAFDCQAAILCRDVKVSSDGMERLYRKAREKGVLFCKYEEPPKLSIVNSHIQTDLKDTSAIRKEERWPVSILSDLLVVAESFLPGPETESLAGILKVHLGSRGFFMEDNPQMLRVRSNRKGIFVAGGCRFPQEVRESLIEAGAVAQEVMALLSNGTYPYDLAVAEVDPKRCAVCYTCPRLCPHSAITVERYGERNVYSPPGAGGGIKWGAARVDPAACYGCGICVAECPAKAITLRHLTDEQIYAEMGLIE